MHALSSKIYFIFICIERGATFAFFFVWRVRKHHGTSARAPGLIWNADTPNLESDSARPDSNFDSSCDKGLSATDTAEMRSSSLVCPKKEISLANNSSMTATASSSVATAAVELVS